MNRIEEIVAELEKARSNRGRAAEQMNLSGRGELFILKYLSNKETPALPSEIGEAMQSSNARISAALGSLEKKGQIHREIDTTNRRNILVTITEDGRERIRSSMNQMRERLIKIFTEMGEQDALEYVRLSKRFAEIAAKVFDGDPPD